MRFMQSIKITLAVCLALSAVLVSCKKNDQEGAPIIEKVRPVLTDEKLSEGKRGEMVVIVGNNLSTTRQVYFNDTLASFNPTYVTRTNIIINIPAYAPFFNRSNKLRVVTDFGEASYDFKIIAPPPVITSASPMHVKPGDNITVLGENMGSATPGNIKIGGVVATIVSQTNDKLVIKAPATATHGTVDISLNGQVSSSPEMVFIYRQEMFNDELWQNPANPATWGFWGGSGWGGAYSITTEKKRMGNHSVKAIYDQTWGTLQYGTWGDNLQPAAAGIKFIKFSVFVDEPSGIAVMNLTLKNEAGIEKSKDYSTATGKWVDVVLPLSDFGSPTKVQEVLFKQGGTGAVANRKVYYDEIFFL